MAGRKPKLTEESLKDILDAIKLGLSDKDACNIIDVSETAFIEWKNIGNACLEAGKWEKKDELKVKLVVGIKKAQAGFKATHLKNILKATSEDWKASAWMLERKCPDEFGRVDRNKISSDDNSGIVININNDVPTDE